jgi:5'-3' exonuclease
MGIQHLNKFLKDECKSSIKEIGIQELSGKKIAVDISIYMFKYSVDDGLIENMYTLFSIFRYYNIIPVFVFDGKTPIEKKELIQKRREDKVTAESEFNILKKKLNDTSLDSREITEISNTMDGLKKKFVYLNKNDFTIIKKLIMSFGFSYIEAPGEADEICASLTIKGKVWGCLSEDMDMFVYGCPRVIRYLSLLNHKCVLYDLKGILGELKINLGELRQICVLSGTDYNKCDEKPNLFVVLKMFKKFKKHKMNYDFYTWLLENTNIIDDYELLEKINNMFDLSISRVEIDFDKIKIMNTAIDKEQIKILLKSDGFVFPW